MHAGQGAGAAGIDALDAGVGVRAGQQRAVQHPAHLDVVGEDGLARRQLDGIDFRFGFAHCLDGLTSGGVTTTRVRERASARPAVIASAYGNSAPAVEQPWRRRNGPFQRFERRHVFAAQDRRRAQNGLHRFDVARSRSSTPASASRTSTSVGFGFFFSRAYAHRICAGVL